MQTLERPASLRQSRTPLVARIADPLPSGLATYDAPERYDPATQLLEEGRYFMGSPKSNTRCNKFTLIGSDKSYNDDTKERKS
jgi:hypothetical protein